MASDVTTGKEFGEALSHFLAGWPIWPHYKLAGETNKYRVFWVYAEICDRGERL